MILAVAGSGRKTGHSTRLLRAALDGAADRGGAAGDTVHLADLAFRGCVGCLACRSGAEACVLDDDLTPVLQATARAEALILAAPIYYGYPSGLFKSYLDRWYAFRDPERNLRIPTGRRALLILTQGHPDPAGYPWTVQSLEKVLAAYGFAPSVLVAAGLEADPEALLDHPGYLDEARARGAALAGVPSPAPAA